MVTSHSSFEYQGQVLIEKMKIRAPYRYEAYFQDMGCFLYFKQSGPNFLSATAKQKLNGNEAVLLKCGHHFLDLLRETADQEVEVMAVHLFPEVLKKLYTGEVPAMIKKQRSQQGSQVVVSSDVIAKFIDSLEFYFENPSLVNDDLLELKIKELILLLVQSKNVNSILELVADLYSDPTFHIREVVDLHLYSDLKVSELAKLCNLSLSSFKRAFKKEFDDSPTNYINNKRIEKAKQLLTTTGMTITEVAFETGFQDALYFTRLFKNKIGIPPSQYKSKHSL